jgi:ketosteroid isomerase-like protein
MATDSENRAAAAVEDTGRAMSEENVDIVREIYHAVARRDAASAFAVYADDIVWEVSARRAIVMDRAYHGHEGVRRFWRDALLAFGEVDLDVEELIDAGDRVVALIRELRSDAAAVCR